jgi:hypothetical protein
MRTLRLRTHDLEWREVDDEIVLLDAHESTYLAVTGSGTSLWRALASGATREQLAKTLVDAYGIDEQRAAVDTDQFIDSLAAHRLLA